MSGTYTLTFGDRAENHKGMEIIGTSSKHGLRLDDLQSIQSYFETQGLKCKCIYLNTLLPDGTKAEDAYILLVRKGLQLVGSDDILQECSNLIMDKQALMYGRVVNKKARHNLCMSDYEQEPDIPNGKGRVISFSSVPYIQKLRELLQWGNVVSASLRSHLRCTTPSCALNEVLLQCEINHYYDTNTCYISYHGDTERKIVVGARVGESFPLWFQWFLSGKEVGNTYKINLNHGDLYFMSEKTVGFDWKHSSKYTLRHAAHK